MTGVGPKGTEEDSHSRVMDGWQEGWWEGVGWGSSSTQTNYC